MTRHAAAPGLEEGKLFSAVVREAKQAGYTEPDPRDDLSGADVARKARGGLGLQYGLQFGASRGSGENLANLERI